MNHINTPFNAIQKQQSDLRKDMTKLKNCSYCKVHNRSVTNYHHSKTSFKEYKQYIKIFNSEKNIQGINFKIIDYKIHVPPDNYYFKIKLLL